MVEPLLPFNVIQQAAGDHVKGIAAELNVSLTTVYKMLSDEGYDPHGRLLTFHKAVFKCNPPGADLLFEDYQAFHESLKSAEGVKVVTRDEAVVSLLNLAESMVKDEDFETTANEAIRTIRFLLAQRKKKVATSHG